ncbi:MAG: beta-phosphoglucomutase, partial [Sphaerochaetaceae bacterium]
RRPAFWKTLSESLALTEAELIEFATAAAKMFIPFDEELAINPQDDQFLERQEWDTQRRGAIHHPMLLNYHPLVIYRHRVIKQADTILAMFLLSDYFPWYLRKRNFDFYEPLTTGDSSLSACIQGIVALECGHWSLGMDYIRQTALMDIEDLKRNTKDGLHTAAMAGSWMVMVYGVAGYRLKNGVPTFNPHLPAQWQKLSFTLQFKGITLKVTIKTQETTYRVNAGELTLNHRSEALTVGTAGVIRETKPTYKAVIFDLDGVVTSTDEYHYRAWKSLADSYGWKFDRQINQQLRGVSRLESLDIILRHNNVNLSAEEKTELTTKKNTTYRAMLAALTEKEVLPGIREFMAQLKERGFKLAVASASRNAPYILDKLGLSEEFDVVVPAEDVLKGKGDPEIFAKAADMLNLFPEECIAIEDSPVGIEAIKKAKMRAIGVGEAINSSICDFYVETTNELEYTELITR